MSHARNAEAISRYVRHVDRIRENELKADSLEEEIIKQATGWLVVSFFALNSGGLVAILNSDGRLHNASVAGSLFFFGMVASVFTGISGIFALITVNSQTIEIIAHISGFEESRYSKEFDDRLNELLNKSPQRWAIIPVVLGFAAGGLALAGVAAAYAGFEPYADANRARCLAIQQDMLSAHPRRSDGPDLFQALGCRPTGLGGVSASPTDREKKAGHPLPWGGYPPSR